VLLHEHIEAKMEDEMVSDEALDDLEMDLE
jgi:hypothetical protein